MRDFEFFAPTHYKFGKNAYEGIGDDVAQRGWDKVLLVYGKSSAQASGLLDAVRASLEQAGVAVEDLAGVRPNPEVGLVRTGIDTVRSCEIKAIVAVGGGSAIDCAKAVAFGSLYEGDVWDFFCGKATVERALPIAAVLTLPAAGSEGSSSCVISNDELGVKNGTNGDAFRPTLAYLDPQLTFTLPAYQTAAGVTDMIAHVCERIFSGVEPVSVTDQIAYGLVRSLIEMGPRALENPQDYEARANIMWASTLAHNDIAGCGRSVVPKARAGGWESHGIEHALSAFDTSITHGAGLAVVMPAWMRYVWRTDPARFLEFGAEVFGIEPIEEGDEGFVDDKTALEDAVTATIDNLAAFFQSMGMPATLGDFGVKPDDVDAIADMVIAVKGESFGCFQKLDRAAVVEILSSAL